MLAPLVLGAALAQAPAPEFRSGVELITLDAVVVDSKGNPVLDLTRDEFVVKEDGKPQELVSFERFGLDAPAEGEPPVDEGPATGPRGRRRAGGAAFALIVDDEGMGEREARDVRAALAAFFARMAHDGDAITLAATSGAAWWTATMPEGRADLDAIVARLHGRQPDVGRDIDYISDYEANAIRDHESPDLIARVVQRWTASGACMLVMNRPDPGCPASVRAAAAAVDGMRRRRTDTLLATLRRTLQGLAGSRGRKSAILLSRGFLRESDPIAQDVAVLARAAAAAVYFIDARGLETQPGLLGAGDAGTPNPSEFLTNSVESGTLESLGAQTLADETGGFSTRNSNDLGAAVARAAGESRAYYLLGLNPRADAKKGDWRKLSVSVTRPGVTVRTRKGYTLRDPASAVPAAKGKGKTPLAVTTALLSAEDARGIDVRVRTFAFEPRPKSLTRVLVAAEFDAAGLRFEGSGARNARLTLGIAVAHRDSGGVQESLEEVQVRVADGETPGWRSVAREFELPAGVSQARVVVRDAAAGMVGSATERFEVAGGDALRITTPILSDRAEAKPGDAHPRAALAIHRVFRPHGPLFCEFEVLGARAESPQRAPRVTAGVTVKNAAGAVVRKADPTLIAPDERGRVIRLVGIGMDGLAEGDYVLTITVRDDVAGGTLERAEPFTLRAAP